MSITVIEVADAKSAVDRARARSIEAARIEAAREGIFRRDPTPQHEADLREAQLVRRDALETLSHAEADLAAAR
jgi:hypothetical protein